MSLPREWQFALRVLLLDDDDKATMSATIPSMSEPDTLGTNSIRHTWVPYVVGLLPLTFWMLWDLLSFVGVLDAVTHSWDNLCIASVVTFLGGAVLVANYFQTKNLLPEGSSGGKSLENTIQRSTLINDLEFEKYYTSAGLFFFIVTLAVYLTYNDIDGNTTYPTGYYISNVTDVAEHFVYSTRGAQKLVITKITMAIGMVLAFLGIAKFFTTDQGGAIAMVYARMFGTEPGYTGFASKQGSATSRLGNKGVNSQRL
jgi:hypothetical protein